MTGQPLVTRFICPLCLLLILMGSGLFPQSILAHEGDAAIVLPVLQHVQVYLQAGDYRRAVETCQKNLDMAPSVEGYVYLAYVYQALDGYLDALQKKDDWVRVEHISLNLTSRRVIDLIDPPDILPRMAFEIMKDGLRQQFDVTAAMADRLDKSRTQELWQQQSRWRETHPDRWWAGVPDAWRR